MLRIRAVIASVSPSEVGSRHPLEILIHKLNLGNRVREWLHVIWWLEQVWRSRVVNLNHGTNPGGTVG